ncbi:MAG: amino acid aminotransferase [Pseudomonadota bacterium]
MFEQFERTQEDPIIRLMGMYRKDERAEKIDVGVGVFKDENGSTPIMSAVKAAEQRLHDKQSTKAYVGLAGDERFNSAMTDLIFGGIPVQERIRAVQAPGGCGALSVLTDTLSRVAADKTVWVSDPTWGNHYPILQGSGFDVKTYAYFNRENKTAREDEVIERLKTLGADDIVLLHGCCHNPTGAELSPAAWDEIAKISANNGWLPYVDLAYQGFGDSLKEDAYGVRAIANQVESMVVAASCSKNFGLYRDRVGCAMVMGATPEISDNTRSQLLSAARSAYSMPPDHGAAIVAMILNDETLTQEWEAELATMRARIRGLRQQLSDVLKAKTGSDQWDFIARHRGMFSTLVLSEEQTDRLVEEYAVYAVKGGRINIAGLRDDDQLNRFADALISVTQ